MALKIQDGGLSRKMADVRAAWNTTNLKLHLYSNNVTPTTASVLGDFTECTFAGYAAQSIVNWTAPSITSHVATIGADPLTFTRSTTGTSQNVYGYYVTDAASAVLYWAELDPSGPKVVTNAGDSITITPQITDQSL